MMKAMQNNEKLGGFDPMDEQMQTAYRVFGNILTGNPSVTLVDPVPDDGDLAFSVPLSGLIPVEKISELERLLGNRFWCDFIGEALLRRNISFVLSWIANETQFDLQVEVRRHLHFGVGIDDDRIVFSLCASKLMAILNDELAQVAEEGDDQ